MLVAGGKVLSNGIICDSVVIQMTMQKNIRMEKDAMKKNCQLMEWWFERVSFMTGYTLN